MPRLAVIGHPVAHSRSPAMHNAALAELGMAGEWSYEAIDIAPDRFEERVLAMPGEGFAGANVTVPHKEAALAIADVPSHETLAIGAANTLVFTAEGIEAHNTDARGLLAAVRAVPVSPRGIRALVLGAGGAARAAIWGLSQSGAVVYVDPKPCKVDVWNRTTARAESAYRELGEYVELGGAPVESPRQEDYGIIVNATSVGLHGENPFEHLPLRPGAFHEQVVVDLVYGERPSELLRVAEAGGATVVDGIEVLVRQGALSFRIWTGREAPLDAMRAAARA